MKLKYYPILVFIFCVGCDTTTEEPTPVDASLISGTWKETEAYISSGGPQYWVDVKDGEEIAFFANGTFSSDRFAECSNGKFFIVQDELRLDFSCDGFTSESEDEDGLITYKLEFYSNYFIVTPTSGPICIEGCSYKFERN